MTPAAARIARRHAPRPTARALAAALAAAAQPAPSARELELAGRALHCAHLGAKLLQLAPGEDDGGQAERGLAAARALAARSMSADEVDREDEAAKRRILADIRNKVRENQIFPGVLGSYVRQQSAACRKDREELKQLQAARLQGGAADR